MKMVNVGPDCDRKAIIALAEEIYNLVKALNKVTDILGEHERRLKSLEKSRYNEDRRMTQEELIEKYGQEEINRYLNNCNEDYACGDGDCIFYKEDGCLWHDAERKEE